ncbi:tetraprenyl-beta-curcumene synthase family protein [Aneurinibacillus tyrosinisolvens]|uniref:tetraprenyl-beta-curcumene synthase family protein n=1 Tax=Aneurinibacillus tyrosinisolvens TaxID=1443435 RepID=UPI00063FB71F|nr:tetraprenyl-beta-curcumene synthase family protein [Aneurinibacillus tyrosinisolvens]
MYPKGPLRLMYRIYRHIFPAVREELTRWKERALSIPDPELRKQALDSIENKTFHCEGGSVYAAGNMVFKDALIRLIVAYQTISDYLDNLCDRSTSCSLENFKRLHQAMQDAVSLAPPMLDYYAFNDEKDDGGYLRELVLTCQQEIRKLARYPAVKEEVHRLATLYCELQTYKHLPHGKREERLLAWWENNKGMAPGLSWNEFAAATGSTLGVFCLFQAASDLQISQERINSIMEVYFPWICSLHILLDYLIDLEEDQLGGDLNFIASYSSKAEIYERLSFIARKAKEKISVLPDWKFHEMIIDGLLGLYLSDGKVTRQPMVQDVAKRLIRSSPLHTRFFFLNSRGYRGGKAVLQAPPTVK